jgi:hypothetical protein
MVFNATFNNISVLSWLSVSLMEETGENHRPVTSHWQTLSHNVVLSTPCHEQGSNSLLQVPTTRTKTYGNHRFDKTASTLWNNIPLQLKTVDSLLAFISDFLYHLTNVFTNCSMNIDQLVFKLLEVTLVLVRKKFKVPIVKKSSSYCWAINEQ